MSESRHHFKMFLALVLIVGILGLIAYANTGENLFKNLKVGRFAETQTQTTSEPFNIVLTTESTTLYGTSFSLSNSPVTLSGICNSVKIESLTIEGENTRCDIEVDYTGSFDYSSFGSVTLKGKSSSLKLNSNTYKSDNLINFEIEVIPISLSVIGVSKDKLLLIVPSGKIEKFINEELKGVSYLSKSSLEFNNLAGNIELSEGTLKVTGSVTAVKSEEFSW